MKLFSRSLSMVACSMSQSCSSSMRVVEPCSYFQKGRELPPTKLKNRTRFISRRGSSMSRGTIALTIPHHVSYAGSGGSMWIPNLAQALREQNDSFQNIADVKKAVHDQLGDRKQQCKSVSQLNTGALYLQKRLEE